MAQIVGYLAFGGIGRYLCFVYVTTWLRQTEHIPASTAFDINIVAILLVMVLGPFFGDLSDRIGHVGPASAFMVEAFPTHIRCSALSFAYSTSLSVFGGTAPMVAVFIIQHTQNDLSPALYMMGAAAISLLATIGLRDASRITAS